MVLDFRVGKDLKYKRGLSQVLEVDHSTVQPALPRAMVYWVGWTRKHSPQYDLFHQRIHFPHHPYPHDLQILVQALQFSNSSVAVFSFVVKSILCSDVLRGIMLMCYYTGLITA